MFDRVANIDVLPDGYTAMIERESIKVMIAFRGISVTGAT